VLWVLWLWRRTWPAELPSPARKHWRSPQPCLPAFSWRQWQLLSLIRWKRGLIRYSCSLIGGLGLLVPGLIWFRRQPSLPAGIAGLLAASCWLIGSRPQPWAKDALMFAGLFFLANSCAPGAGDVRIG